jgi:hypothetical protein
VIPFAALSAFDVVIAVPVIGFGLALLWICRPYGDD